MRRITRVWLGLLLAGTMAGCAPTPPSGPSDHYLVYFDAVSAELTPTARQAVAAAAQQALAIHAAGIRVAGHASATGSPAGNQKLSQARVEAVAAALQKDGVDPTKLHQAYLGETDTGDPTVAERRVDIILLH